MALWRRIRPSDIDSLSRRCQRCHSVSPAAGAAADLAGRRTIFTVRAEPPLARPSPSLWFAPARSFAAPVQAKPKPAADEGPRLNQAIIATYVRLVTDQGHNIVSRREALYQAEMLNLDLVEVQRNADPPVCKIMDFHKEKFNKEMKEKEKAKSKVTLRNGENKEVRFKAKTELKDLKIKASQIERLMERGYRVKCTSLTTNKENEDLVGLLSTVLELIKDVAVVETGPHVVDTKQAYAIVRHVKFATKKGGKKISKVLDDVQSAGPDAQNEEEWEPVEFGSDTEREGLSHQEAKARLVLKQEETNVKTAPTFVSSHSGPPIAEINRYSKQNENKAVSSQGWMDRGTRNDNRGRGHFDRNQRPFDINNPSMPVKSSPAFTAPKTAASADQNKPGVTINNPSMPLKSYPAFTAPRTAASADQNRQAVTVGKPSDSSVPSKSFGIFSSPKEAASADQKARSTPGSPTSKFGVSCTSKTFPSAGQRNVVDAAVIKPTNPSSPSPSYGILSTSKNVSPTDQRSAGDATASKPRNPGSPTSSYGIFSSNKQGESVDKRNLGDASNPSSPPRYGVFSASRTAASGGQSSPGGK